jgi:hypothetical protein
MKAPTRIQLGVIVTAVSLAASHFLPALGPVIDLVPMAVLLVLLYRSDRDWGDSAEDVRHALAGLHECELMLHTERRQFNVAVAERNEARAELEALRGRPPKPASKDWTGSYL